MISFLHQGSAIYNPFLSGCGSRTCRPEVDYEFELWNVGSAYQAFVKQIDNGESIWLKSISNTHAPTEAQDCKISYLDMKGVELCSSALPSAKTISELNTRLFLSTWGQSFGNLPPKTTGLAHFSQRLGYSIKDILDIGLLEVGATWRSLYYPSHTVCRLS